MRYLLALLISCLLATVPAHAKARHRDRSQQAQQEQPQPQPPRPAPQLRTLSESPRIIAIDNFLTPEECDHIIKKATPELQRSTVVDDKSSGSKIDPVRTSQGMFFQSNPSDKILRDVEARIAAVANIPVDHGEGLQVLRYAVGGEYKPHYDYFDPTTTGGAYHYHRGGQRVATLIMYLNTVEEGGETIFPRVDAAVKPVKGNAVLFYNCTPDNKEDPLTLHGGAPVLKGEKWIATKWMRAGVFR